MSSPGNDAAPRALHVAARYLFRHGGGEKEGGTLSSGTVKWFNAEKGYGFIAQPDGGEDVFVHHSAIQMNGYRTLEEGQLVEFEVKEGPKGLQAVEVKPAGAPAH